LKKYTASRLVSGNRVFPSQIIIDEKGITIKNPSFFSGDETTIPFSRISSVSIDSPFVGYSTIIIETTGEGAIKANGFLKSEVIEIKEFILNRLKNI
jgi:hypothetical protein